MSELATTNGSALAISADQRGFTEGQVEALKKMNGWERVPDAELAVFFHQAQRTGLDPFARQIYLIGRYSRKNNRTEYTIQTSIDGMRLVADRTGAYAGSDRPTFGEDGKDRYAEVTVWKIVQGSRVPFTGLAYWSEFHDERSPMWKKMPRTMLAKTAEAQALRKAFPADLSGLYSAEEMDQAGPAVGTGEGIVEGEVVEDSTPNGGGASKPVLAGGVLNSQIGRIENLSEWIWSDKRAVEAKLLKGHKVEELTQESAKGVITGLQKTKEKIQAEEDARSGGEEGSKEEPAAPEGAEGAESGQEDTGGDWTDLLKALADRLYADREEHLSGHEWLQRELGKPFTSLNDEEAQELYEDMEKQREEVEAGP